MTAPARTAAAVAARVRRLADALRDLKDRVRRAVATEAAKAVADAVRDVFTTVLAAPVVVADPHPPYRPPARDRWAQRPAWDDDRDEDEPEDDELDEPEDEPAPVAPGAPAPVRPAVAGLIAAAARTWVTGRLPGWAAVGLGALAAAIGVTSGPVGDAIGTALAAAVDLVPHLFPPG